MIEQTESEIACEEAARLTAELQEADSPDDDDEINYNELPPPPGKDALLLKRPQADCHLA